MTLKYEINGKEFRVYLSSVREDIVEVQDNKVYKRTIHEDDGGKFFTWNKSKVYLDDFKKVSMSELRSRLEKDEFVTTDDLIQSILTDGVDNVRFEVPFSVVSLHVPELGFSIVDSSNHISTECKIVESFNREVKDSYKLDLFPVNQNNKVSSHESYYIGDLVSSLRNGSIKILESV